MIVFHFCTLVETDGRWIGCVPDLPGVLTYASSQDAAARRAQAAALRIVADGLERGAHIPGARLDRPVYAVRFIAE